MINGQVNRLSELNQKVRSGKNGGGSKSGGFARYERLPDYTAPSVSSSRPRSDRGVTFHFKHSFVSKRNSVSAGYRNETSASAHQEYIERQGAAETVVDEDGLEHPTSFGTIGENKSERTEFWRKVERTEGRTARVQCRMIVEMPHELDPRQREALARDFCQTLEDEGMPYWCVVHAPDKKNDRRNHHMHIAYSDRPAQQTESGLWDFEIVERMKGKNRVVRERRPHKQRKPRHAQGADWVRRLRRQYADVANAHLSLADSEKRYDARSYQDSGTPKTPTLHMGTARAHAESQGLDTRGGVINSRREISYRLSSAETAFMGKAARMSLRAETFRRIGETEPDLAPETEEAAVLCAQHESLSKEAMQVARKQARHDLAGEIVVGRLDKRIGYLDEEAEKLVVAPPREREDDALDAAMRLWREQDEASSARTDLTAFAEHCRRISRAQQRRLDGIDREQSDIAEHIDEIEKSVMGRVTHESREHNLAELLEVNELAREIRTGVTTPSPIHLDTGKKDEPRPLEDLGLAGPDDSLPHGVDSATSGNQPPSRDNDPAGAETSARREPDMTKDKDPLANLFSQARPANSSAAEPYQPTRTVGQTRQDHADKSEAMRLSPSADADTVADFDRNLERFTNAELRRRAFATRDRADLSERESDQHEHAAALKVIQHHAQRRGLDLDSGIHRPERAKDSNLARRHQDTVNPLTRARWWDPQVRTRS